jgi:hypothetical protein
MLRRYIEEALINLAFAHLNCPLALQLIKRDNYRMQHQIGDTKLLVASASRILPFFV